MVEARNTLGGRLSRHASRRSEDRRCLRARLLVRGLQHEPAPRRSIEQAGLDRVSLRRRGPRAGAWWAGSTARSSPLSLEEREVGPANQADVQGHARVLGGVRLSQLRRSLARAALPGGLMWRVGMVTALRDETATARTITLQIPDWPGHLAGQHVDVRLTAADGYSAVRSYSIASAPDQDGRIEITVERLPDGEVSPYLTQNLVLRDPLELTGPIGGWFVWRNEQTEPVQLIAGGSGIVPLMAMIRSRGAAGGSAPFRLLYSV